MARISSRHVDTEQLLRDLFGERYIETDPEQYIAELRETVKRYEVRYGIASERIHEAIDAGALYEDVDVGEWIFQYTVLRQIEAE